MTVLAHCRLVVPGGIVDDGWLSISGGSIDDLGAGERPGAEDLSGHWLLPGFVDLHVHGGGGHSVVEGDPAEVMASVEFHRRHGTTTTLVSLVTAPADTLLRATTQIVSMLADASPAERDQVAGIHLEGPYLSVARCGAQDPAHMIDPDPTLTHELLSTTHGEVRVMTLAPERPHALDLVSTLSDAGVVAAVGHTDATYEQTVAAIEAGAVLATHLANGMRPFHHREPGPIGACLADPAVVCELIVDGHHLHPATVRMAAAAKGENGLALITDAIAAAGEPDGRYRLGAHEIDVNDGEARVAGGGSLAGSTLTMDAALRNAMSCGLDVTTASGAASLTPARVLGIDHRTGSIEKGKAADLVILDESFGVVGVVARGELVHGSYSGNSGRESP